MNIGFFGGTFDPIHNGHLALARAARERCQLGRIYFVPSHVPPHRKQPPKASYFDRYAMVVLATLGEKDFVPSLLEAPGAVAIHEAAAKGKTHGTTPANYSVDTIRRLKQTLKKSDRLFFLIGIDAFAEIATWHQPEALLKECEFIVASRPGYSLADVADALPANIRPKKSVTRAFAKHAVQGDLVLPGATIHLLENVHEVASATAVRNAVSAKKSAGKALDPAVAAYIKKLGLYK